MKIVNKLLFYFLLVAMIPLVIVGFVAYRQATEDSGRGGARAMSRRMLIIAAAVSSASA
jgi:hypothetical protein